MVLTTKESLKKWIRGDIVITPFNKKYLGLQILTTYIYADTMAIYRDDILDQAAQQADDL